MQLFIRRSQIKSQKKASGFSLIEFAISLAALLPVVFGAIDINNTLRAYNALSKGSEVALRCIYPTDGACMEAANAAPRRLFNWFESNRSEQFFVRDMQYRGFGEWLSHPIYTYDTYRAQILGSVSFEIPRVTVTAQVPSFSVSHAVSVWARRTGLPWVVPNNQMNPSGRDVRMTYDRLGRYRFPRAPGVSFSGETIISRSNRTIRYGIHLENPLASNGGASDTARAIYRARAPFFDNTDRLPQSAATALENLEPSPAHSDSEFRAIVYVKGNLNRLPDQMRSKLLISINGRNLGGQAMEINGPANFYPRGVGGSAEGDGPRRIADERRGGFNEAEWEHAVTLHPGSNELTISWTAQDDHGQEMYDWGAEQTWAISSVEVYLPRYELASFPTSCTQSSCAAQPCSDFQGIPVISVNQPHSYPAAVVASGLTTHETGSEEQVLGTFYSLAEATQSTACDAGRLSTSPAAPTVVDNQACPNNHGAVSEAQRAQICPPMHEALSIPGVTAQRISWSTREISVPQNAAERSAGQWDFEFNKQDCTTPFTFSAPTALRSYPAFIAPSEGDFNSTRTRYVPIGGITSRPSDMKGSTPAYSCDAIRVDSMTFDGHQTPRLPANLPAGSLFSGAYPERSNTPECSLNLRDDALSHGLPQEAWFYWTATPVREVRLENRPSDLCTVFRQEVVNHGDPTQVASGVAEGVIPPACADGSCTKVFAGFDTSSGAPVQQGPDIAMAQNLAYEAIVASYPRAQTECQGETPECVVTAIETDNAAAPTHVSVRNSMRVPLNLLGGGVVTLSSRQERELETSFVK